MNRAYLIALLITEFITTQVHLFTMVKFENSAGRIPVFLMAILECGVLGIFIQDFEVAIQVVLDVGYGGMIFFANTYAFYRALMINQMLIGQMKITRKSRVWLSASLLAIILAAVMFFVGLMRVSVIFILISYGCYAYFLFKMKRAGAPRFVFRMLLAVIGQIICVFVLFILIILAWTKLVHVDDGENETQDPELRMDKVRLVRLIEMNFGYVILGIFVALLLKMFALLSTGYTVFDLCDKNTRRNDQSGSIVIVQGRNMRLVEENELPIGSQHSETDF